jgi:hypothetical protein
MTMRPRLSTVALILVAGGLSACAEVGGLNPFAQDDAEGYTAITTEQQFRDQLVGREVLYANGAVGTYGADGTWSVVSDQGVIASGTWQWSGDRWCRQGASVEGPVAPACEAVAVSAEGVRFTREDGTEGTLPFRS